MRKSFAARPFVVGGFVMGSAVLVGCGGIVGPTPDFDDDDGGASTFDAGAGSFPGLPGSSGSSDAGTSGSGSSSADGGSFGSFGDDDGGSVIGDDDGDDSGIGSGDDTSDASTSSDAGAGFDASDSSAISDAGSTSGAPVLGSITFSVPSNGIKGSTPGEIRATFFTEVEAQPAKPCTETNASAACVLTTCTAGEGTPYFVTTASTEQAGAITTVESGVTNVLIYKKGGYSDATYGNAPYNAAIAISAAGFAGEIPAFSLAFSEPGNPAITAPTETLIMNPHQGLNPNQYAASFPRSQDLTVSWTGGVAGTSLVAKVYAYTDASTEEIVCTFDQGAGSGVVPSAGGLASFPVVDGTQVKGTLTYDYTASSTTTAGAATITASVSGQRRVEVSFTTTN